MGAPFPTDPMPKQTLKDSLAELHVALKDAEFKNPEDRERLDALLSQVEAQTETPRPFADDDTILGSLEEAVHNLEVEHPVASSILQRIAQLARTLGGAGI